MRSITHIATATFFALALSLAPALQALSSTSSGSAPVPPQIYSAHTAFISNGGGPNYFNAFTGGADRGYNQLYAALQQWGKYQLVDSPSQADLIFEIRSIAPAVSTAGANESSSVSYNPQLVLRILDPKTSALLWTTTVNVKAFGLQSSRDKGFDESIAVLVDRVRQLTGESLTTEQVKAIHANSHMSRSTKILIGIAVGAAAGFAGFGIYKATRNNMPSLPPACLNPPSCPIP